MTIIRCTVQKNEINMFYGLFPGQLGRIKANPRLMIALWMYDANQVVEKLKKVIGL